MESLLNAFSEIPLNIFIAVSSSKNMFFYEYLSYRSKTQNRQKMNEGIKKGLGAAVAYSIRIPKLSLFFPSMKTHFCIQIQISLKII